MPQAICITLKDYFHTQSYMLAEIIMLFSFNYRECTTEIFSVQENHTTWWKSNILHSNTIHSYVSITENTEPFTKHEPDCITCL